VAGRPRKSTQFHQRVIGGVSAFALALLTHVEVGANGALVAHARDGRLVAHITCNAHMRGALIRRRGARNIHFDQRMVAWVFAFRLTCGTQIEVLAHSASVAHTANGVFVAAIADEVTPHMLVRSLLLV